MDTLESVDILKSDCDRYVRDWDAAILKLEADLEDARATRQEWASFAAGELDYCKEGEVFEGCRLVNDDDAGGLNVQTDNQGDRAVDQILAIAATLNTAGKLELLRFMESRQGDAGDATARELLAEALGDRDVAGELDRGSQ